MAAAAAVTGVLTDPRVVDRLLICIDINSI
jgi:hypothetical protein